MDYDGSRADRAFFCPCGCSRVWSGFCFFRCLASRTPPEVRDLPQPNIPAGLRHRPALANQNLGLWVAAVWAVSVGTAVDRGEMSPALALRQRGKRIIGQLRTHKSYLSPRGQMRI